MSARTFVDTNVLVYLFDASSPHKQKRARERIRALTDEGRLVLSTQVLQELYVTLTRKLTPPLTAEQATEVLSELSEYPVVPSDAGLVLRAVHLARRHLLSLWDALIVEAARAASCDVLLTEDLQDGQAFQDVVVRNPFSDLD